MRGRRNDADPALEKPMNRIDRRSFLGAVTGAACSLPYAASAQTFPTRTVQVVLGWAPGGSADFFARLLAQAFSERFGQSFVVDNRAGAAGTVGHAHVARQRPDGYTLLFGTNSTFIMAPFLYPSLPYDNAASFTPISLLGRNPQVLCVHPSLPPQTLPALIEYLKARPEAVNFSSSGVAGTSHMAMELFMSMAGVSMTHVPYRGGGPAAQALVSGEVSVCFVDAATAAPLASSSMVRALGISSTTRSPLFPDVPTIAEAGLTGFESSTDFALMGPAGLPDALVQQLLGAVRQALADATFRERLIQQGITPIGDGPAEFVAYREQALAKWGRIIRERNIRAPT